MSSVSAARLGPLAAGLCADVELVLAAARSRSSSSCTSADQTEPCSTSAGCLTNSFLRPSPTPVPLSYRVRCSSKPCARVFDPPKASGSAAGGKGKESARGMGGGGRKIGTQEKPIDTRHYDVLGVPVNATTDE